MLEEFYTLLFKDYIWIPHILLFLAGNLCWKSENENKPSVVPKKKEKQYHEVPKKTNIYFCLIIAIIWLILADNLRYPINPFVWVLFSFNQGLWIIVKAKYFRFLRKKLVILETPQFRSQNNNEKLLLGKINSPAIYARRFFLNLNDLRKHMFVCGLTGMGKSNFIQVFLTKFYEKFPQIPFFIIEFKGEYQLLKDFIPDIQFIHPGESFSINIFDPLISDPDIHAERLFDILRSCEYVQETSEFSPQMEKVLVDILKAVCSDPQKQNFPAFEREIDHYRAKYKNQIPMLEQTIISITNRLRRLFSGPLKNIFSQMGKLTIEDIFSKRVCLDLSSITRLGGEKRDALFFLNMIFKYLWDRNLTRGSSNKPCHMCVLEDAQYMVPAALIKQSKLSNYIEDVALLQRGTGEILVSIATRPAVSENVLANAGVFVTFQSHYDTSQIQELLGLKNDQVKMIGAIQEGECIMRVASIPLPFSLKIPLLQKKNHTLEPKKQSYSQIETYSSKNKLLPKSEIKKIFICYFNNIRGPLLLPFSSPVLGEQESQRILGNLEKSEGFFEIKFGENRYLLNIFEVPSDWGRGNVELFMIGVKTIPEDEITEFSEDLKQTISEFISNMKRDPNFYKVCYYERMNEDMYSPHSGEINQEYLKLHNKILELEENLYSKKGIKIPKNHKLFHSSLKLNNAQFEALRELNDTIEQLLSKEK